MSTTVAKTDAEIINLVSTLQALQGAHSVPPSAVGPIVKHWLEGRIPPFILSSETGVGGRIDALLSLDWAHEIRDDLFPGEICDPSNGNTYFAELRAEEEPQKALAALLLLDKNTAQFLDPNTAVLANTNLVLANIDPTTPVELLRPILRRSFQDARGLGIAVYRAVRVACAPCKHYDKVRDSGHLLRPLGRQIFDLLLAATPEEWRREVSRTCNGFIGDNYLLAAANGFTPSVTRLIGRDIELADFPDDEQERTDAICSFVYNDTFHELPDEIRNDHKVRATLIEHRIPFRPRAVASIPANDWAQYLDVYGWNFEAQPLKHPLLHRNRWGLMGLPREIAGAHYPKFKELLTTAMHQLGTNLGPKSQVLLNNCLKDMAKTAVAQNIAARKQR